MNKTHENEQKEQTYEEELAQFPQKVEAKTKEKAERISKEEYEKQLEQFLQEIEAKAKVEAKKMSQEELEKRRRNCIRLMQDSGKELQKARKYKEKIKKMGDKWINILLKYEQEKEMNNVIGNMQESLWILNEVESICDRYHKTYRAHHKAYCEIIDKNEGKTA